MLLCASNRVRLLSPPSVVVLVVLSHYWMMICSLLSTLSLYIISLEDAFLSSLLLLSAGKQTEGLLLVNVHCYTDWQHRC